MVATRTNARASRKIAAVVSLSRFTVGLLPLEFERLVGKVADCSTNDQDTVSCPERSDSNELVVDLL